MKKLILLTALLFTTALATFAQIRYADLDMELISPTGDTMIETNTAIQGIHALITNLSSDTVRMDDTIHLFIKVDTTIIFTRDYTQIQMLKDDTIHAHLPPISIINPAGQHNFCIGVRVRNTTDIITDNILFNNDVCLLLEVVPTDVQNINLIKDVTLYPNPAADNIHLLFNVAETQSLSASVMDVYGRVVHQTPPAMYNAGHTTLDISTRNMAQGNYIIQLKDGSGTVYWSGRCIKH